jgi:uncharacterized protein (UPF0261 family)
MATVVLLGTLDTKGVEYAFLRDRVVEAGCDVVMVNAGVLGDPDYPVEFTRADVAAAAGADIAELSSSGDRGASVTAIADGAAALVGTLFREGRLDGILGAGGSGGTSIISRAMRGLPVGVPKMLVSTMGASDTRPHVGTSDIAMVYSVVDIAGINAISARVLGNAAAGIAAMAEEYASRGHDPISKPLIGATMYGTTTPCVERARAFLEDAGYEVLVFHATGTGGRSMEALMASGFITGSLDVTTTELTDEIAGGTLSAGPERLDAAGSLGLPQVVSLGATDQITFTPPEAVPAEYYDRTLYRHNPSITLVRTSAEECGRLGALIAQKLNAAQGPTTLFIPVRGTSLYGVAGAVFHDPVADRALFSAVKEALDPSVDVIEMDTHINDPEFALAMARTLDEHYRAWLESQASDRPF